MDHAQRQSGVTLVQVMIVIIVMTLIALVAVPSVTVLRDESNAGQIVRTCEMLRVACERHRKETGRFATEDSQSTERARRQLSLRQDYRGWDGPYLGDPLGPDDGPGMGGIVLHPSFQGDGAVPHERGFRVTGPDSPPRRGPGQFVAFHQVSERLAEVVDRMIDQGLSGNWRLYGRVQWSAADDGTLMIHLLDS